MRPFLAGAVILALAVAAGLRIRQNLLFDKEVPARSTKECALLDSEGFAVEDLVQFSSDILIGGAGGVIASVNESPESQTSGHLVYVDGRSDPPTVSRMKWSNIPEDFRFLPHGLSFSHKTQRLYAVNHAGVSSTGSRIEVFDITSDAKGHPEASWRMAVGAGHLFPNCGINSVVEGPTGDELFVTQWQNAPVPEAGAHHPTTLSEKLGRALNTAIIMLSPVGNTGVWHCSFDADAKTTTRCHRTSAWGFVFANGITTDASRTKLFVVDLLARTISVFKIGPGAGELTPLRDETIIVEHPVDNIHLDEATGEIHQGTITRLYEALNETGLIGGSHTISSQSVKGGRYDKLRDVVYHDGTLLSQISTCMPLGDRSVCGSPLKPGVLVCK